MGLCGAKETEEQKQEKLVSKQLSTKLNTDGAKEARVIKLLLLGAGESGKSTLFKQMLLIYGKNGTNTGGTGMTAEERKPYVTIVNTNVITSMKELIKQAGNYGGQIQNQAAAEHVMSLHNTTSVLETMDQKTGQHILSLWNDPGIQTAYANRARFQLNDSAQYFFNRIKDIIAPGYVPTTDDVLRSRVRTTGIVENDFMIDGNQFKMFDVGGQRNERKKWIHCFEKVTAVMFVAAISEYDQSLYEDESTNRMDEALALWTHITSSQWFAKTSFILFLNKRDLFAEKIDKVPLTVWRSDCPARGKEQGEQYMEDTFRNTAKCQKEHVYPHVTCATDTGNVAHVFNSVKDIVIQHTLEDAGLFYMK